MKTQSCQSVKCWKKNEKRPSRGVATVIATPQECESSSSVALSTRERVALAPDYATMHRSSDASGDEARELSSKKLDAMPCKISMDLTLHRNPSNDANKVLEINTFQTCSSSMVVFFFFS